ncbi:MAG: MBL fold metallo-hydrolase [Tepidisphaera sp.]|nr:MBL fold metallo-hydrolase [Tepidisphaera sp.]
MRFEFLGTGTSSGIPSIGCACDVCTSTDPRDTRLRTSAAIRYADAKGAPRTILIDAGPDLRQQAITHQLDRCDAILFTHNHVDHTFGLDEVRRFNVVMNAPIDIYAEPHTQDHLRRVYKHIFDRQANVNDSFVATLIMHTIEPRDVDDGRALDVFGLRVTPIRLLHGRLPVLGFRISPGPGIDPGPDSPFPLAYCTDVSAVPPESWARLAGVKTLVLDALRHRHHPTHFTLAQAVNAANQIGAQSTYFVHMSHDLGHAATQASLPDGMFLAHDGLVLGGDGTAPAPKYRVIDPD